MSAQRDKAVVERFVDEVMNAGNLAAADELIDPDHVNHDPTAPEGVKELISMYREAFPDIRFHTGEMFADGEGRVAHRWTFTGTHQGEMMGVEPTGKKVEVSGVEINHLRDGRISASYTVSDALGLMRQLGAL